MKSPQLISQDSLSQLTKNRKNARVNTSQKFKVNLKNIKLKARQSTFLKPEEFPTILPGEQLQEIKQSFYFRVRVISKIGVFIEKLKSLVALSNPNFKNNEMDYIQSQTTSDNQPKFLFSSQNRIVLLIEAILFVTSIISVWNVSFLLLFPQTFLLPIILRYAMLALFGLEIVMGLFVIPDDSSKQQNKTDHKTVIIEYLQSSFFYDFVSLIGLIVIQFGEWNHPIMYLMKVCGILKIITILRIIKKFQTMFVTNPESQSQISIFKLTLKILTFVHLLSLTLNLLNQVQNSYGISNTWLKAYGMAQSTDFQKYLCGWYWGATILTTVGFGDIAPANIYEAFIISFIQIICCALFGYSINYIGGLIGVLGQSTQLFQKQMRRVNKYLQNLDINRNLKQQIRQHFFNKQKIKQIHDPVAESIVMDNIPLSMKTQVLSANNKNVLLKTGFFQRYNDNILNLLAMKLKRIIYSPDEAIFNKGQSNSKLWILQKGNISQFYNNQPNNIQKIIAQYNPTTVQPGYINFITGQPFTTYCRSLGISWTYQVSREDMLNVLIQFKSQYHKFCELKDRLIQKGKKFVSRCCACLKLSHNALECPKIHFHAKIKLYKLASLSRLNVSTRHFYPRQGQKYKSLALFSLITDQQSLAYNSIHVTNRRMSMQQILPQNINRHSRRISTLAMQYVTPRYYNGLPPLVQASRQHLKTESQTYKAIDQPTIRNHHQIGQFQLRFWFDQCKFSEKQSYFSQSHVQNIVLQYNRILQQNKETSRYFQKY